MKSTIYKCFIASPSDTAVEREICEKVFSEINKNLGDSLNFKIESLKWENDTRPSFGDYSQAVINEQIGNNYQIFIGIMARKFGTPTKSSNSGTEEEFLNAYERLKKKDKIEIMFYFNDEAPKKLSEINTNELDKVNAFKKNITELGAYYCTYEGAEDFSDKLRQHLTKYFLEEFKNDIESSNGIDVFVKETIRKTFQDRLNKALCIFSSQPIIWVEPHLSKTNEISFNPDDNYQKRIKVEELLISPESTVIKAPPQFGLTSLSHYLIKEAWENGSLWVYLDADKTKPHNIHNAVKNEAELLGFKVTDVQCIILDSWSCCETNAFKKLKNLCNSYKDIPIYVMQRIEGANFLSEPKEEKIERDFKVLHLLALPRNQVRKVVCEYNKAKGIGEEEVLLSKVVSDLETLNIHRTPLNCLTLLKVSEKYFDESPVNRTKMIEMVLFVLFNLDGIPTYKTKPDLKDCEYVLGRFCEKMIRNEMYEFSRESFLKELNTYCKEKLIDLEVDLVFDILSANNIIIQKVSNFSFGASYWVYYFAAKRMYNEQNFADYIFTSRKYIAFPEIIEFYTGIDRLRTDALKILTKDIKTTCDIVNGKVGLPDEMNPFNQIKWRPTPEQIQLAHDELSENVIKSGLPESIKDQFADRDYNQIRPYNQSIQSFFEKYSLYNLMQNVKACSRALRNSDYVEPNIKRELLNEILRSWLQISKVLLALTPVLASKGRAAFEGQAFILGDNFGDTLEEKVNTIIQANPTNVVGFFKADLFSNKLGPLLYEHFSKEKNPIIKHQLALFIVFTRPRVWKKNIEEYIVSLSKDSFFLYDIVNALRARYRFDFATNNELSEISYLIKMGLAKNEFGIKKPGYFKISQISNKNLPKREFKDDDSECK